MDDKDKLKIWKRKKIGLEAKVKQLNSHKSVLIDISSELNKSANIKLSNALYGIDLKNEISYLNDWIEFYSGYIEKYESRLKEKRRDIKEEASDSIKAEAGLEESFKLIFDKSEKQPAKSISIAWNCIDKFKAQKPLIKYVIPFIILSLIIASLFLIKPSITGYAVLSRETDYNKSLNLMINESSNYTWALDKQVNIKSIRASGSVSGNGSIKVYIEKDGQRHLIYENR